MFKEHEHSEFALFQWVSKGFPPRNEAQKTAVTGEDLA
jgi:hypothetical protein